MDATRDRCGCDVRGLPWRHEAPVAHRAPWSGCARGPARRSRAGRDLDRHASGTVGRRSGARRRRTSSATAAPTLPVRSSGAGLRGACGRLSRRPRGCGRRPVSHALLGLLAGARVLVRRRAGRGRAGDRRRRGRSRERRRRGRQRRTGPHSLRPEPERPLHARRGALAGLVCPPAAHPACGGARALRRGSRDANGRQGRAPQWKTSGAGSPAICTT